MPRFCVILIQNASLLIENSSFSHLIVIHVAAWCGWWGHVRQVVIGWLPDGNAAVRELHWDVINHLPLQLYKLLGDGSLSWIVMQAPDTFITFNARFLVFNAQFLVLTTKLLVFTTKSSFLHTRSSFSTFIFDFHFRLSFLTHIRIIFATFEDCVPMNGAAFNKHSLRYIPGNQVALGITFVWKMMNYVSEMMNFVLKMMALYQKWWFLHYKWCTLYCKWWILY